MFIIDDLSESSIQNRLQGLSGLIGKTPLLKIEYSYKGEIRAVYAKAEYFNFTGSIKDRMTFNIFRRAYETGELKPGYRIVEATSGNTGISVAAIGSCLGHEVIIYMPDWMSQERVNLIKSFGASVVQVSRQQGGFLGCITMCKDEIKKEKDTFLPCQFSNWSNPEAHYVSTGPEIWEQLGCFGQEPDAFVAGVGTGGTVMGAGMFFKQKNRNIKVHPLEPLNSPTLSTGTKHGKHRIQGISDDFIPPVLDLSKLDDIISIDDGDAIIMAKMLAKKLGLGVGISSGANFLGAVLIQERQGKASKVATVFVDDSKKYLSTDLMQEEPAKAGYISNAIELLGVYSIK